MEQPIYDTLVDEIEKVIPVIYKEFNLEKDAFSELPSRYQAELLVNSYIKRIMNERDN
jgi:hypothetical protein